MHKLQWDIHRLHSNTEQQSFLHKSNIKLPENRKFYTSKHLYECNKGDFKIMSI